MNPAEFFTLQKDWSPLFFYPPTPKWGLSTKMYLQSLQMGDEKQCFISKPPKWRVWAVVQ